MPRKTLSKIVIGLALATLAAGQSEGQGVAVGEVVPHSPAARAGIRPGDVIVGINGRRVSGWPEINSHVADSGGRPVAIDVIRRGRHLRVRAAPRAIAPSRRYGVPAQGRVLGIPHWEERWVLIPCPEDPDNDGCE